MSIIKSKQYHILMIINVLFSSSYLWFLKAFREFFEFTANPYIMLFFYLSYPFIWGISTGICVRIYWKDNIKRHLFNWGLLGINILLIFICWKRFYDVSFYNIIICGLLLIEILFNKGDCK